MLLYIVGVVYARMTRIGIHIINFPAAATTLYSEVYVISEVIHVLLRTDTNSDNSGKFYPKLGLTETLITPYRCLQ